MRVPPAARMIVVRSPPMGQVCHEAQSLTMCLSFTSYCVPAKRAVPLCWSAPHCGQRHSPPGENFVIPQICQRRGGC
jgi:hypothetical protein